ncbi:hypothetical protein FRW55_03225 [Mycoplasma anserisalpingitidis]|uniref:Uncharacterized protein n=1 Tax=Mycoplasma anserisalpingitidis TaxID=519450 RepID=A0A5B8K0D2_9MOLU|nr:hypothetical protein [Mycoplasma anserisalpingitidis]QDY87148.1 hypothetical protein FRW55_03225 [Mycoplasma anserisalpingitidis]
MKELIVKLKSLQSQKIYWTMSILMIEIVLIVFALNVGEKTIINWGISEIYIFVFLLIFFIVLGALLYILLFNYFDNKIIKMVESVGWNEFNSYLVDYKPHQLHYNRYLEIFNILKYKKKYLSYQSWIWFAIIELVAIFALGIRSITLALSYLNNNLTYFFIILIVSIALICWLWFLALKVFSSNKKLRNIGSVAFDEYILELSDKNKTDL